MSRIHDTTKLDLDYFVYPGQPLVIACMIMTLFESYQEAVATEPGGSYGQALTSIHISGAGGNVHAALSVIKDYKTKKDSAAAIAQAHHAWAQYTQGTDRFSIGLAKAKELETHFIQLAKEWKWE